MMGNGEDVVEYDSDPEETKISLKTRRREASDEEEEECGKTEKPLRSSIDSDNESEGQGVPAVYEEEVEDEEVEDEEVVEPTPGVVDGNEHNLEKKENEPYAVPKAGAFYMHDERFGDNVAGQHKRMSGGRMLWESKDDRKWGHDKFEELTGEERSYDEDRRTSRGHYRGRDRIRGADSGASLGRRPKA